MDASDGPEVGTGLARAAGRVKLTLIDLSTARIRVGEQSATQGWVAPPGALLGRHPDSDICIDAERISRAHAIIELDGLDWVMRDVGSTHGTEVRTAAWQSGRLARGYRCPLEPDARVVLAGTVSLRVAIEGGLRGGASTTGDIGGAGGGTTFLADVKLDMLAHELCAPYREQPRRHAATRADELAIRRQVGVRTIYEWLGRIADDPQVSRRLSRARGDRLNAAELAAVLVELHSAYGRADEP